MAAPVKKFQAGGIQVAVWENEGSENGNYNTVSFDKRYKDKEGNWQSTKSLNVNDIPKAVAALNQAYQYLVLKDPSPNVE